MERPRYVDCHVVNPPTSPIPPILDVWVKVFLLYWISVALQPDFMSDDSGGEGEDDAYLQVGGVRIRVSQSGRINSMSRVSRRARHGQHQQSQKMAKGDASSDGPSSLDSDEMLDYLNNIEGSECSNSDENDSSGYRSNDFEILKRFSNVDLGNEGAVEDIIGANDTESERWTSTDTNSSSDEEEDFEWDNSLVNSTFSGPAFETDRVLRAEDLELLEPALRYPISVKQIKPSSDAKRNTSQLNGRKKKKSAVKGARGGLLAPGEKAKLRRQRIEEKRAQRAVHRGFDLAWVNKQLSEFVEEGKDVHCFPPFPKHECRQIQKLASLYGCKSGAQGSGKRRSVIVTLTTRTELPQGDKLIEIGRMLTAHSLLGNSLPIETVAEAGRWKGISASSSRRAKKSSNPLPKVKKPPQPITFVSRGFHDESTLLDQGKRWSRSSSDGKEDEIQLAESFKSRGSEPDLLPAMLERQHLSSDEAAVQTPEMHPGRLLGLNMALSHEANVYRELEAWQKGSDDTKSSKRRAYPKKGKQKHCKETSFESEMRDKEGSSSSRVGQEFGGFERHTKGVGSRILEKWGFAGQGAGLGREGSGIAEPITVTRREKGLGLGA